MNLYRESKISNRELRVSGRSRLARAFTMVELMVVIGLIAMMATIAIPSIVQSLKREGMRKAVNDLEEAIRLTRTAAIFSERVAELVIRPGDRTISINAHGGDGSSRSDFSATLPEDIHFELLGVNFIEMQEEEEARIRFYPNGMCDECTVVLRSDRQEYRKLTLDIITGRPEIDMIK